MDKKDAVDLLHPLSSLKWNQVQCPVSMYHCRTTQCIILNDKFYLATLEKPMPRPNSFSDNVRFDEINRNSNVLFAFSLDFKEFVKLSVPVEGFALTHYHSQLVLVGGEDPETKEPTNQVLVSADGTDWKPLLPPMRVKRRVPSAVNTMHPECLVVVGSCQEKPNAVEVFTNGEWFIVPLHRHHLVKLPRIYMHNGTLIILDRWNKGAIHYCRVESLLASCAQSHNSSSSLDLWKEILMPEHKITSVVSIGRQLVGMASDYAAVLCPSTQMMFRAESLPQALSTSASILLPTGEMLVLLEFYERDLILFKASVKLLSCNLDDDISEAALHRLNAVGFRLYPPLIDHFKELIKVIGFFDAEVLETIEDLMECESGETCMPYVMDMWISRKDGSCRPPTWRSFFDLLKELGLAELSQQIRDYLLTDFPSLKEQCMAVVMSGLLQQRLESDQLHARLPDYIPTTLRDAIVHSFKARTLQLVPEPGQSPALSSGESLLMPSTRTDDLPSSPTHSTMNNDLLPPEPKNMKFEL